MRFRLFTVLLSVLFAISIADAETVGLALSGGGARGFAHVGVLKALEEEGIVPDLIVGSSMGAIIGGLYAAGYSPRELESIVRSTDWSGVFLDRPRRRNLFLGQKETVARHILSMRFRGWVPEVPMALSNGQELSELLFDYVYRARYQAWPSFDDLKVPFRALATDITTGEAVIFSQGDLAEAMRASISLPLVFMPYRIDDRQLVDGGVIENIPVDITREEGAEFVIAVDLTTGLYGDEPVDMPWELTDRVSTIMHIDRNRASRSRADVVIQPDVGTHGSTDFTGIDSLIEAGYRATRRVMPLIREQLAETSPEKINPSPAFTFASRATAARFESTLPERGLPPDDYLFEGITQLPDTQLQSLPNGEDGLGRLRWVRRTYQSQGCVLAHAADLEMGSDGVLYSRWEEGRIRSVEVSGVPRSRRWTLLREFPLRTGDVFNVRRARRGINQIYGSGMFQSVSLSTLPTDSGAYVTIRALERHSPQLRFGAGYSTERKGRGFVEFLQDNLGNLGARLAIFGKYAERDEVIRGRLAFDRVLNTYFTGDLTAYWSREENYFFDAVHHPTDFYFFERSGVDLWAGQALRRWGQLAGGVRYQDVRSGGVPDSPTASLVMMGLRSIVDTKDSYPFPTKGVKLHAQYEYAARVTENNRFNRLTLMGDAHLPLTSRVVAHGRADYGWNDFILPLWGRFPLGGQNSMLGLRYNERLGNSRVIGLAELRYDLVSRFLAEAYVSGLYTIGGTTPDSDPYPSTDDYQHAVGGSFSLSTFLGPMTFTAAELLPSHFGTGHTQLYLNLGHDF